VRDRRARTGDRVGDARRVGALFSVTAREILAGTALGPIGFACGWLGAKALGVRGRARRAICLETGIQNAPLAIGIVIASFSGDLEREILRVPLLYGVLVVPASALVALAFRRAS
jgi:BASS family bile acid:Na+ symporter